MCDGNSESIGGFVIVKSENDSNAISKALEHLQTTIKTIIHKWRKVELSQEWRAYQNCS